MWGLRPNVAFGACDATNAALGQHPEQARGKQRADTGTLRVREASGRAVKGSLRESKSVKGSLTDHRES